MAVEDRWLLSRLATVTGEVTAALEGYHFADASRVLYDFAWNEFCSFYVEMVKSRLSDPAARPVAQRMLAHTLDVLLRLLHPMVPFITEEVWQLLGQSAPERGLDRAGGGGREHHDRSLAGGRHGPAGREIEARFALFQQVLGGLREIRSRQNIPPKTPLNFVVVCDPSESGAAGADGALFCFDGQRPRHRLGTDSQSCRPRRPAFGPAGSRCWSIWRGWSTWGPRLPARRRS